jgi:putative SbcD/Mre11-related phosphoesterase
VLADLHLGYDDARRATGEALPAMGWFKLQDRLARLLHHFPCWRLIVAGDLVEHFRHREVAEQLLHWLAARHVELGLVPGNHDRGLPSMPGLQLYPPGLRLGRWRVVHQGALDSEEAYVMGHHHPMLIWPGSGRRVPCYLIRGKRILLPAFSDDAAGLNVMRSTLWRQDFCFAIVAGGVRALGQVQGIPQCWRQERRSPPAGSPHPV